MQSLSSTIAVYSFCALFAVLTVSCESQSTPRSEKPTSLYAGHQVQSLSALGNHPSPTVDITLTAVGDLMCSYRQMKYTRLEEDVYNFHTAYGYVRPLLKDSDFTIGNLETTLGGPEKPYTGFPRFNAPDDYARAIKDAGFDFLFTSNNHSMDTGEEGLRRTVQVLDELGLQHTGTFTSQADKDSIRIVNVKGMQVALLAYTGTTNKIPVPRGRSYLVSYIEFRRMRKEIAAAREKGAELVITYFHIGEEYSIEPSGWQQRCVGEAQKAGADIILSSHPHVLQPIEYFKTQEATLDTGLIVWSMGNFFSNDYRPYSDAGNILNIHLTQNRIDRSVRIADVDYVPTWIYRGTHPEKQRHLILPAEWGFEADRTPFLNEYDRFQMRRAFNNTCEIVNARGMELEVCHPYPWKKSEAPLDSCKGEPVDSVPLQGIAALSAR